MGSGNGSSSCPWSVFDVMKVFPSKPETLMAEIDSAIAISEYTYSRALLYNSYNQQKQQQQKPRYDAHLADQAYKSGCAALAAGKHDDALRSLETSLSVCPPDKASAISKLRSLISFVSQQRMQKPS